MLASRLRQEVQRAFSLKIERSLTWTDSTTVLEWLQLIEKQPVSVANRVTEIPELTKFDDWSQVPKVDNPADAGTRGLYATVLFESS